MRKSLFGCAVCLALVLGTVRVDGHHSFSAEFNADDPVKLTGTVARVEWINPHMWIHIDVKSPDGKVERWKIEGGGPNALVRRGLTKASLPVGSPIIIEGYRAWDGSNTANGSSLRFSDGRKLFMGSSGTSAPYDPEK